MIELTNGYRQFEQPAEDRKILNCFECYMDNIRGVIIPTDSRLMFIQNGVESKDKKTIEIRYDMIETIKWTADNGLYITLINSPKNKKIETIDKSLDLLEKIIKVELRNKKPSDDYCYCENHILTYG